MSGKGSSLPELILASGAMNEASDADGTHCCMTGAQTSLFGSTLDVESASKACPANRYCGVRSVIIPDGLFDGPKVAPGVPDFAMKRYVPLVNPLSPRTFAHSMRPGSFPAIAVQLWPLIHQPSAMKRIVSKGLADSLDYDGKTILSSVMPDGYIMKFGVDWYINAIKQLHPSAAITWDVPTYVNHPRRASLGWLLEGVDGARRMAAELETPLIGLVSGATLDQVRLSSTCLKDMGFEAQAIACREYLMAKQTNFLGHCVQITKSHCASVTMVSCSSPSLFARFPAADHFIGMGWYNLAYRGLEVTNRGICRHLNSKFDELAFANLDATISAQDDSHNSLEEALGFG